METERCTAVANLEDEKRIQELEMIIQEETERTTKINGVEQLVASICLTEAEAKAEMVKRIQELKMMMQAETERAYKITEDIKRLVASVGLLGKAEAEKRIQKLKMMMLTERERSFKIIERNEKMVASMALTEAEAEAETEVKDTIVEEVGENFPAHELGDMEGDVLIPKPEFDNYAPQPEAEERIQELEVMIQAEREKAASSVEELRKFLVSLDLSPTEALLLNEELDHLISLLEESVVSQEGVLPMPKPESDDSVRRNETTRIEDLPDFPPVKETQLE